jgi:hypothetical protein
VRKTSCNRGGAIAALPTLVCSLARAHNSAVRPCTAEWPEANKASPFSLIQNCAARGRTQSERKSNESKPSHARELFDATVVHARSCAGVSSSQDTSGSSEKNANDPFAQASRSVQE